MTSRALAIRCLVEQNHSKEAVDQIFAALLDKHPLQDERDRQLAMALVYGVLRHRQELDVLLQSYSKTALGKLKPHVLQALRIGLAQLLFLDRIPESAAVNETIKALGRQPKWLKGFVNGVLRTLVRNIDEVRERLASLPPEKTLNHPDWLVALWDKQFGPQQTQELCKINNSPPPLSLRVNSQRLSREDFIGRLEAMGVEGTPGKFSEQAVLLADFHGRINTLPGYDEGLFHVQDEAAQLIASFFTDLPSGTYLDGCAGLGGKTILLDQVLPADATLVANEPNSGRLARLKENIERCQCRPISFHSDTLQHFAKEPGVAFDGVLLDAPCSGLGVIRRQPDIRWNRCPEDLEKLAKIQMDILTAAAKMVSLGGVVVYVTCSLATLENEEVVAAFLSGHPEFSIKPPLLSGQAQELLTEEGFLRTLPSQGLDGFFAARLIKNA